MAITNVFDEMGVYWAEIADKNQTEKQIQFLKHHLKPEGFILDLACGSGRHIISLCQQGYSMVGLDISAKLLKIAKARYRHVQVVKADMRFLHFKNQAFTAIISMDASFGYLPSEADDETSLVEVRRALIKGSVFIIDLFNRNELTQKYKGKKPLTKDRDYSSFSLKQQRTISQNGETLRDKWIVEEKTSGKSTIFNHIVRLYDRTKLEGLLGNARLAINQVYGGYDDESFNDSSLRLIILSTAK